MSPQQPEFVALAKNVEEIRAALIGDPLEGRNGIIHYHQKMVDDLYGLDPEGRPIEGKTNTVLMRLSSLEEKQKKALWTFTGIVGMAVAIKFGLAAVFGKIFDK
jgi:hypothetical protein